MAATYQTRYIVAGAIGAPRLHAKASRSTIARKIRFMCRARVVHPIIFGGLRSWRLKVSKATPAEPAEKVSRPVLVRLGGLR